MRKLSLLSLLILLIINVSCLCENNQIDINEASMDELDKLSGIGPAKAQAIIDSRPFNSVDDLIEVTGIGEVTLEKIKSQGLACTDKEDFLEKVPTIKGKEENEDKDEKKDSEEKEKVNEINIEKEIYESQTTNNIIYIKRDKKENVQREAIVLTSLDRKDIKTKENKENSDKNNYAIYALIGFGILLLFLFVIKKYKRVRKNEFK